jgi:ATP-dependent protease ClpP protease subunit
MKIINKLNPARFFNAASSDNELVMDIFDVIGDSWDGAGITAQMISNALQTDCTSITLNVNSPGGDLYEGVAIRNLLAQSGKPVNVNVVGLCASAASLIATAGNVTMAPGTMYMVHEAQGMSFGDADAMRKCADTLATVTDSAADLYVAKTGKKKADILALMKEETWLTPDEAVEQGFADCVADDRSNVTNSCAYDLSMFRRVPEPLKNAAKTKRVDGEDLTAEDFVYAGNPHDVSTWSLPWHFSTDELTKSHLRDALARFDQDEVIPESHKAEARAKLVRLCKQYGIEVQEKSEPDASNDASSLSIYAMRLELNRRK